MLEKTCNVCPHYKRRDQASMDDLEKCIECFNSDYEKPEGEENENEECYNHMG